MGFQTLPKERYSLPRLSYQYHPPLALENGTHGLHIPSTTVTTRNDKLLIFDSRPQFDISIGVQSLLTTVEDLLGEDGPSGVEGGESVLERISSDGRTARETMGVSKCA
jgi:hypothetical protein